MRCFTVSLKENFAFLNGSEAVLEAYLPYNMTEMCREHQRRPCVLICPGGGYAMCSQREAEPVALQYLKEGYNTFVLWYTVAPKHFPHALREVAASVELIHRNAEAWNCDESFVAILGFSAGGHLAALYSNAYDWPEVREVLPESKPVQASVLCYPVISADPAVAHMGSFECLIGHLPSASPATVWCATRHRPRSFGTRPRTTACRCRTACVMRPHWPTTMCPLSCTFSPTAIMACPSARAKPWTARSRRACSTRSAG